MHKQRGDFVQFFPSGTVFRFWGSVGDKDNPIFNAGNGVEAELFYQEDGEDSAYFLVVEHEYFDDECNEVSWRKWYELGPNGLVEVADPHGQSEDGFTMQVVVSAPPNAEATT